MNKTCRWVSLVWLGVGVGLTFSENHWFLIISLWSFLIVVRMHCGQSCRNCCLLFKALRAVRRARSPILMFKLRAPTEFTFRPTLNVFCCTSGIILKVTFGPREHFGDVVGSFWGQQTAWGTKSVPRATTEAPTPKPQNPKTPRNWNWIIEISVNFIEKHKK